MGRAWVTPNWPGNCCRFCEVRMNFIDRPPGRRTRTRRARTGQTRPTGTIFLFYFDIIQTNTLKSSVSANLGLQPRRQGIILINVVVPFSAVLYGNVLDSLFLTATNANTTWTGESGQGPKLRRISPQ